MSREASDGHTEHKTPKSAISTEADHNMIVRRNSEEQQVPTNITLGSALPDPDDLKNILLAWIRTSDWPTSQTYLQTHPELLTELAEQTLVMLMSLQQDRQVQKDLLLHQQLLQAACQQGVEDAYAILLQQNDEAESASNDLEELENQLVAWLQTPDLDVSQNYLQAHPQLLTEQAEQLLEQLKYAQPEEDIRSLIDQHLTLLHQGRTWEIAGVYACIQLAEQAESIDDHEWDVLLTQLEIWLAISDCEQEQRYLEQHPGLLTGSAEFLLAVWWLMPQTHQNQINIALHLQLLQHSRAYGITTAYRWLPNATSLDKAGAEALREYWTNGEAKALEQALACWQQAIFLTPPDSPNRPIYLYNLGSALCDYYEHTRALSDLERAITLFQQAVEVTLTDSPDHSTYLINLGSSLRNHYLRTGALSDLERAITLFQQAVEVTETDSPDLHSYLSNLGITLSDHYKHTGILDDLEQAILLFQQAVDATPAGSPNRSTYLTNLGSGLRDRYLRTGILDDLEQAIFLSRQAVEATPTDSPNRSTYLSNLSIRLRDLYRHTGTLVDLEQAITFSLQAVEATSLDSLNLPIYLNNLGLELCDRYLRTGSLDDLERTITIFRQAIETTPPNSPNRSAYLTNLGGTLRDRYLHTGALDDLEQAITLFQQAVKITPTDSPNRSTYLTNLGGGLRNRYMSTGVLDDLEQAITAFQQAVDTTLPDSPDLPGRLSNLGSGLIDRYRHTRVLNDLERTIAIFQQAVDVTPHDSPNRSTYLSNLSSASRDRYLHTGDLDSLEQAIALSQQAVEVTPHDSLDWPLYLTNLGSTLRDRYLHTGDLGSLEQAIALSQQAVEITPVDSPNRSIYLTNLGIRLRDLYEHTRTLVDLERVITTWEITWSLFHLHFVALPIAYQLGRQRQSVHMATSLVTAHLERAVKHRPNARIDRCRALEVAEGNKSRLLTQLIGRGPLPLPTGVTPEFVVRERRLLSDLTDLDTVELATYNQPALVQEKVGKLNRLQQRQKNLKELEDLWVDIARIGPEGMEYAALRRGAAPTWQDLSYLAQELGSTTALLSFFTISDQVLLFLVRTNWRGPRVSKIPFNKADWDNLLERFFREVHLHAPGLQRKETWDLALQPLLTQTQQHLTGVERLILAPEAHGHLLPWSVLMERVGWHTPAGKPLPLVTLPTLGVLSHLRRRPRIHIGQALVVGNPTDDLPYAEEEAKEVATRFGAASLLGSNATKETVLPQLIEASLIHLATHAFFDPNDPLESGIVLADGILTAREVLQQRLHADLLVLSACESGQIGSLGGEELAGLSQAFLQAGVRSLLVSLWQVNDLATAALIQAFYTAWQAGADKALALRQAMTQIQQDPHWTHPYYWGAFVLMGDWN